MSSEVEQKLLAFVRGLKKGNAAVDANTDLITSGILDSLSVMELVAYVSNTFDISISASDITPTNLRSVATLHALVEARK